MGWNNIGDDGITAIARPLSNSSITLLNVMGCGISVVGVRLIAKALSSNQNIRTLLLFDNPITIDGAHLIMKSAVGNPVYEYISINAWILGWWWSKEDEDYSVSQKKTRCK